MQDIFMFLSHTDSQTIPFPVRPPTADLELSLLRLAHHGGLQSFVFPGTDWSLHRRARGICLVRIHAPLQPTLLEHPLSQCHVRSVLV